MTTFRQAGSRASIFYFMVGFGTILWMKTSPCCAFHGTMFHRRTPTPSMIGWQTLARHRVHVRARRHLHTVASSINENDGEYTTHEADAAQDIRLFLTQRTIQSFMFLLASTRDLHTVGWLDRFVQPITINNYWSEDVGHKPGAGDTFRENDKRYDINGEVICVIPLYISMQLSFCH
jgi:hypothetical protein